MMRRRTRRTIVTLQTLGALAAAAATVGATSRPASAQAGNKGAASVAQLRITVQGTSAASGVLSFPRQGPNAVVSVVALDAAGKPVAAGLGGAKWTTSDAAVLSLYGGSTGASTRVVAQQDGRATLTVTALGKTASIPVAVGAARKTIAAAEVLPAYRVARLEVAQLQKSDPDAELSGRALLLGENGHSAVLRVTAYAADGKPIPLDDLPVAWATSNAQVLELSQESESEARVVGREPGQANVTASMQGVTLTIAGYVGEARSTADAGTLAEAPAATASPPTTTTTTAPTSQPTLTAAPITATATGVPATTAPTTSTTATTTTTGSTSGTTMVSAPQGTTTISAGTNPTLASGVSVKTPTAPTRVAPTGLTGKLTAPGTLSFTWTAVPTSAGALGYAVIREGPPALSLNLDPTPITGTSFTRSDWEAGNQTFYVAALYPSPSAPSDPAQAVMGPASNKVTINVPRWHGRYRISLTGFEVVKEAGDDVLQTDGKGDEVFVAGFATAITRSADGSLTPTDQGWHRTLVYGDVNGLAGRIKAGSVSAAGGLRTGDRYPAVTNPWMLSGTPTADRLPLAVWEGDLVGTSKFLHVETQIWEVNQDASAFAIMGQRYNQYLTTSYAVTTPYMVPQVLQLYKDPQSISSLGGVSVRETPYVAIWGLNAGEDRPIGLRSTSGSNGSEYQSSYLTLTQPLLDAYLDRGTSGGLPPNVVAIDLGPRYGYSGVYRLYLWIERLQ